MSNTRHLHAPQPAINALNHDVLLDIFHWYRLGNTTDELERGWNLERWWYKLIQVCRTWRHLIMSSPTRLDLHLVCTYGTPVTTMLTHSPPLPLIIYYPGRLGDAAGQDKEDVVFALRHRERVRRIHVRAPAANFPSLVDAMDGDYPVLQHLVISSYTEKTGAASGTGVELPTKLQAPLLRRLVLFDVRLPAGSELLRHAEGLVTLELVNIASPELHPAYLVAQLARMTQLECLVVDFRTSLHNHAVERTLLDARTTCAALPRLKSLSFRSGSAYLEGVLARINAPSLEMLILEIFAQLPFDLPCLVRFVRAAQDFPSLSPTAHDDKGDGTRFQFHENTAKLYFDDETADLLLDSRATMDWRQVGGARTNSVQLRVLCRTLDWQLAALEQICGALAPLFMRVEGLTLCSPISHTNSNPDLDSERAQWHALLREFGSTKTLRLAGPRTQHLLRSLLPLPPELLPALQELLPEDDGEPGAAGDDEGGLAAFTVEREAAGRPVRVVRDEW